MNEQQSGKRLCDRPLHDSRLYCELCGRKIRHPLDRVGLDQQGEPVAICRQCCSARSPAVACARALARRQAAELARRDEVFHTLRVRGGGRQRWMRRRTKNVVLLAR